MSARVDPFPHLNALAEMLSERIEALEAEQLAALKRECAEVSTTNCGWTTYGLRQIVWSVADNEEAWRVRVEAGSAQ